MRARLCALLTDTDDASHQDRGDSTEVIDAPEEAQPKDDQWDHAHERKPGSSGIQDLHVGQETKVRDADSRERDEEAGLGNVP